jgi:nitronate monooxygenase
MISSRDNLLQRLRLPLMAAPMSIASTPALVEACAAAGVLGCFPTHNAWQSDGLQAWLDRITATLDRAAQADHMPPALFAVNISVSRAKPTELLHRELDLCRRAGVQIITTNVGDPAIVVEQAHDWGALVIHDVTTLQQAEQAIEAGVDGLMLVCAGAGGLGGQLSPMAFVPRVRRMFEGIVQLAGGVCTGGGIRAALALGADMACCGTCFIATAESGADIAHKQMLVETEPGDVLWTERVCGIGGNFLRASLVSHGLDPDALPELDLRGRPTIPRNIKPWKMIWSAGHSVAGIRSIPTVADLIDSLEWQFLIACEHNRGGASVDRAPLRKENSR